MEHNLWPVLPCVCSLPSPSWDQSLLDPHGGICVKQDPTASAHCGVQPQGLPTCASSPGVGWHGVLTPIWGCVSLQACSMDSWGQT